MNKVILIGRLARDPELRYTAQTNVAMCRITIAVDRRFKSESSQQTADFINCVAWRQTGEFIEKYFQKGNRIAIVGRIETRSWDDPDGNKRYATEVTIDEVEFVESKRTGSPGMEESQFSDYDRPSSQQNEAGGFYALDDNDGDLPF